jgi:arylsulfatase A-like enzyme
LEVLSRIREAFFQASNALLAIFDPKTALNRSQRFKPYVEAYEVANKIIDKISMKSSEKPFFIWAHFMDTHLPYTSGHGRKWYKETRNILDHLGHSRDINPSASRDARPNNPEEWEAYKALYDASIYTVDSQIARILYQVEQVGVADDTIIAVCSDHGEEFGEHDNFAHQFTFYEHNVRVPLLFYRPGLGRRV